MKFSQALKIKQNKSFDDFVHHIHDYAKKVGLSKDYVESDFTVQQKGYKARLYIWDISESDLEDIRQKEKANGYE